MHIWKLSLVFWPTVLWCLGILEFLCTLTFLGPRITTLGVSVLVSFGLLGVGVYKNRAEIFELFKELKLEFQQSPVLFKVLVVLQFVLFVLGGLESRLPPHLSQEYDAINYHMSLPKQHLLSGSFAHLPWSAADLWPMPIQWGLAPFWFMGKTLHKFPQFLFTIWAFGLALFLGRSQMPKTYLGWIPALAFFSTHGVMIQLGTAQVDFAILYFFLSFLYGLIQKWRTTAAIHLAVFASAKAFSPAQAFLILGLFSLGYFLWKRAHFLRVAKDFLPIFLLSVVFSIPLLSRSILISLERAGTPFFPFAVCFFEKYPGCSGDEGQIIRESARLQQETRKHYGYGHGLKPFFIHLWKVSVPESGVNNAYDYPLGLAWILWLIFLFWAVKAALRTRQMSPYLLIAIAFWIVWWAGSHQSRWLYPTLLFGWLGTLQIQKRIQPHLLTGLLVISATFSCTSQWRAIRYDLFRSTREIQAEMQARVQWDSKSKELLTLETLYVDTPLQTHAPTGRYWILK